MTNSPAHDPSDDRPQGHDDPAVQAEWRRLEAERLAEERAEAREDADEATHQPDARRNDRIWQPLAFAVALAAGIVVAALVNRPRQQPSNEDAQAQAVKQALDSWREAGGGEPADGAGPRLKRAASTATLPAERLAIRVALRDGAGRERLESLLAASGLRIEGDLEAAVQGASAQDDTPSERLAVSGRPAAVDALLDALAAASAVLAIEGDGVFVDASTPAAEAAQPEPAPAVPERVRLWIEIADRAAEPAP